ncbi:MAG: RluA family pseudouridine synthase [Phycisphaeraceae bacterium]
MTHQHRITGEDASARLDQVLARRLDLSRRQVTRLLERGLVRVNGQRVDRAAKGRRLLNGDELQVDPFTPEAAQRPVPAPHLRLHVVAEADDWLIVNKPAHMAVHPLRPEEDDTLLNAVIARHPRIHGVGEGGLRSGVVHRLDLTTSGVVLFALDQVQWQRLRDAFRTHAITKRYRALVHGPLTGEGHDTLPLVIRQHHPARVTVADRMQRQARNCSLRWRVLETFDDAAHVEIELETGFLHQIRVMLAHRGHPLVGEAVYGGESPLADRPLLHALSLTWQDVHGESEPPADFTDRLVALRQHGTLHFR